jgi:hypothetical protein
MGSTEDFMTNDCDNKSYSNGKGNNSSIGTDSGWHKHVSELLTDNAIWVKQHIIDK